MAEDKFIKAGLLTTGFISLVAVSTALVRVRAQVTSVQPFVAIMVEEVTPRPDQPPTLQRESGPVRARLLPSPERRSR